MYKKEYIDGDDICNASNFIRWISFRINFGELLFSGRIRDERGDKNAPRI